MSDGYDPYEDDYSNIVPDTEYNWKQINPNKPDAFRGESTAAEGDGETTGGAPYQDPEGSNPDPLAETQSSAITKEPALPSGVNAFKEFLKNFENDKGNLNIAGQLGLSMLKGLGAGLTADKQAQFKADEAQKTRDFQERMIKEEREARRIKTTSPTIKLQGSGMINNTNNNPYRSEGLKVTK